MFKRIFSLASWFLILFLPRKVNAVPNNFVTVSGENFYLNQQIWRPYGIYYFPSYIKYVPMSWNSDDWLENQYYNQYKDSIDAELADIESIGINVIGIQAVRNPTNCPSLNDFLSRAQNHNLRVFPLLREADPFVFFYSEEKENPAYLEIIQKCGLKDNPTILGYDVAWEPHLGFQENRDKWLPVWLEPTNVLLKKTMRQEWNDWIIANYESHQQAYQAWGYTPSQSPIFDYDAGLISAVFPIKTNPLSKGQLRVTFKNTGKLKWSAKENPQQAALGVFLWNTQTRQKTEQWFNLFGNNQEEILAGQTKELTVDIDMPANPGKYELGAQLLLVTNNNQPGWFGDIVATQISVEAGEKQTKEIQINDFIYGPSDNQLCSNGAWNKMVIAYKRFLDQYVNKKISRVAERIREIDPNHLLAGHSGYGGNDRLSVCSKYPLDSRYQFQSLDFTTIEYPTYHNEGPETGFKTRYNSIGKPVVIMEFGNSICDRCPGICTEEEKNDGKAKQNSVFTKTINVAKESGAAGLFAWWYTGDRGCNLRPGEPDPEASDYGIVERFTLKKYPAYNIYKQAANDFIYGQRNRVSNQLITIDRDDYLNDYFLYQVGENQYGAAVGAGKTPEVKSPCFDKTSEDAGLFNSVNLPRCLDAIFEKLEIKNKNGEWQKVRNLDTVEIPSSNSFEIRAKIRNIREAKWWSEKDPGRAGKTDGNVYLGGHSQENIGFRIAIPNNLEFTQLMQIPATIAHLNQAINQATTLNLQMVSENRYWFGEKIKINLIPSTSPPTNTPAPNPTNTPIPFCFKCTGGINHALGNANCDSKVDLIDFAIWQAIYSKILKGQAVTEAEKAKADFNCQETDKTHQVDLVDFSIWQNNYKKGL